MDLDFGQPDDGIMQMAYVVADIEAAIQSWIDNLGVGPWFLLDRFTGDDPVYRGQPAQGSAKLAMSFAGHMNVELIQPNDDLPSVYNEHIAVKGHGFHHFGMATDDYPADKAKYLAMGYELAFEAGVPTGGKVGYLDTNGALPGYIELIETSELMEAVFTNFWKQTIGWDRTVPIRPFA